MIWEMTLVTCCSWKVLLVKNAVGTSVRMSRVELCISWDVPWYPWVRNQISDDCLGFVGCGCLRVCKVIRFLPKRSSVSTYNIVISN